MSNNYLIDPFSVRIQFSFRNSYNRNTDDYKYRIAIVNEKIRSNMHPLTIRDIMRFSQYQEALTYVLDLKKFRPILRIQSFIDLRKKEKRLSDDVDRKR